MMSINYPQILMAIMMSTMMATAMGIASFILGETAPDKEKVSMYECGFSPFENPGSPISIKFFIMGILFLMFDLEISLVFPWSVSSFLASLYGTWIMFLFLLILTWGLVYEWMKGGLEWQ